MYQPIITVWCNVCQNTGSKKASLCQKKSFLKTSAVFSCVSFSVIISIIFNYILYVNDNVRHVLLCVYSVKKVLFFNNLKLNLRKNK